jgi:hypothetical protein
MLARAWYYTRGLKLPDLTNVPLNQLLAVLMAREQEAEIAKTDYIVSAMALLYGIPAEGFDKKIKVLRDLKRSMVGFVTHTVYDRSHQKLEKIQKDLEARREQDLLKKVQSLGK